MALSCIQSCSATTVNVGGICFNGGPLPGTSGLAAGWSKSNSSSGNNNFHATYPEKDTSAQDEDAGSVHSLRLLAGVRTHQHEQPTKAPPLMLQRHRQHASGHQTFSNLPLHHHRACSYSVTYYILPNSIASPTIAAPSIHPQRLPEQIIRHRIVAPANKPSRVKLQHHRQFPKFLTGRFGLELGMGVRGVKAGIGKEYSEGERS
nr:hypothetical protein Iba_chr05fCG5000 [Ipomoea batatas]